MARRNTVSYCLLCLASYVCTGTNTNKYYCYRTVPCSNIFTVYCGFRFRFVPYDTHFRMREVKGFISQLAKIDLFIMVFIFISQLGGTGFCTTHNAQFTISSQGTTTITCYTRTGACVRLRMGNCRCI